jgi:hypothetical protein
MILTIARAAPPPGKEPEDRIMRTLIATGLATALLAAPLAFADERALVAPSAPASPAELAAAGRGTVAGMVAALHERGFALSELATAEPVVVAVRHLRLDGLAPGELVTVTGIVDDGVLKAQQVIRADGSLVLPDGRRGRAADEDDDFEG